MKIYIMHTVAGVSFNAQCDTSDEAKAYLDFMKGLIEAGGIPHSDAQPQPAPPQPEHHE